MKKISAVYLLFAIMLPSLLFSQIEISRQISVDDGLAYSQVITAFEDSKGIFWFGTASGLSEWNSVKIKNYFRSDGLPSLFITSIAESKNNLVFGTDNGIILFDRKKFFVPNNIPIELRSGFMRVFSLSDNDLFILSENGLWKFENSIFAIPVKISHKEFISIVEIDEGTYFLGTQKDGCFKLKNGKISEYLIAPKLKNLPITDIYQSENGDIIFALQNFGIVIQKKNGEKIYLTENENLPSNYVNDILEIEDKIYIATRDGVAIIKNYEVFKVLDRKSGLRNEFITKIFKPKADFILFLSEGDGIFFYRPDVIVTYNEESGLINNAVWVIQELKNGEMLFTTDEGLSRLKNNKFIKTTSNKDLSDNLIISLYQSEDGTIYYGTHNNGVTIFYPNGEKQIVNNFPNKSVWYILEGNDGKMFFVTHKSGIVVFQNKKIISVLDEKVGLPSKNIISAFKRKDGTILISFENAGVYQLVDGKFRPFQKGMEKCKIWSMFESSKNILYVGTNEYGIIKCYSETKRDTIGIKQGLSNNIVVGFEEDGKGNIYAITDNGLNIINQKEDGSYNIRKVFKISGLANNECNQGAIYKDKNGNIWVGTIAGVTKINPDLFVKSHNKMNVIISSVRIHDYEIEPFKKDINKFAYNQNSIRIEFAGINYFEPTHTKYKYRLVGLSDKWFESKDNFSQYVNLPSGDFVFEVKAANEWGEWSESATFQFSITQPFWLSWWFYFIIFLLLSSIISSIVYLRIINLLKIERIRTAISADLHDEIGSGLSEISILSEILKYNTTDDKTKKSLSEIAEKTRTIIERLSDIIWLVNPRKDTLKDLILRIKDSYHELLINTSIDLKISQLQLLENITLQLEERQHIYLIVKEAVNNAIKYCDCNKIEIMIQADVNNLIIEVADNGKGISDSEYEKGNGLYNMKKRAEHAKGVLEIISENQKGTKIRVKIPLKRTFGKK